MRKIVLFILCVTMLFSLAACGQDGNVEWTNGDDNKNNVTQSKEAEAFEKLKNIIIEKGTYNEEDKEYTYKVISNIPNVGYERFVYNENYSCFNYEIELSGIEVRLNIYYDEFSVFSSFISGTTNYIFYSSLTTNSTYHNSTELQEPKLFNSTSLSDDEVRETINLSIDTAFKAIDVALIKYFSMTLSDLGFTSFDADYNKTEDKTQNNDAEPNKPSDTETKPNTSTETHVKPETPNFEPLEYSGTGDKVITDVNLPEGEFVAKIEMKNGGHLAVKYHYNDTYALLVNDSYNYSGTTLIKEGNTFAVSDGYLEVESGGGSWNIKIEPLSGEIEGNSVSGKGDVVTGLFNGTGKKAVFKSKITTDRHTAIKVYKYNGKRYESELLVNEIGNYEGEKLFKLDAGAKYFFAVESEGDWSISWE